MYSRHFFYSTNHAYKMATDNEVLNSWQLNAREWIKVLDTQGIESRKVTNKAITETVLAAKGQKFLDLGCGEGWLTRAISQNGQKTAVGVDGTEELVKHAKSKSENAFYHLTFEEIINGKAIPEAPYDGIVLNFCLYKDEETAALLNQIKHSLKPDGQIFIQTLHPFSFATVTGVYKNQWVDDSWKGLKGNFVSPHSWYSRTLSSWVSMFKNCGLKLIDLIEPSFPEANMPSSIIFVLEN